MKIRNDANSSSTARWRRPRNIFRAIFSKHSASRTEYPKENLLLPFIVLYTRTLWWRFETIASLDDVHCIRRIRMAIFASWQKRSILRVREISTFIGLLCSIVVDEFKPKEYNKRCRYEGEASREVFLLEFVFSTTIWLPETPSTRVDVIIFIKCCEFIWRWMKRETRPLKRPRLRSQCWWNFCRQNSMR